MDDQPIAGKPVRFPPGRVRIQLNQDHRRLYRARYARYESILAGLPVLRDGDFDGRDVTVTIGEFEALKVALKGIVTGAPGPAETAFSSQEADRSRLFKRLQYLS